MPDDSKTVSVVLTVKNDPSGCRLTLSSLLRQTRPPDEIIVVDGGSTDQTPDAVRTFAADNPGIRLITAPGANIAAGRNIGTRAARGGIIATTDAGCRAAPEWLASLLKPFSDDSNTEFVGGTYRVDGHSLFETVVGLATMRGQLEPISPDTFNPSGRSMAYTKALWARAGGWPEWIRFSEDTLFDHRLRRMNVPWRFAGDAIVSWRPRTTWRALAKQFYNYGTGRGHTQIGAPDFTYNLRNITILFLALLSCFLTTWAIPIPIALGLYFYVWTFHSRAMRIVQHTRRKAAYPVCLCVMWVVLFANLAGYLVGTLQRWRDRARYEQRMDAYLSAAP